MLNTSTPRVEMLMRPPVFGPDHGHHPTRRAWTPNERGVVLRGLVGRLSIAIEPLICALVFAAITIVPFFIHREEQHVIGAPGEFTLAQVIAPIFGLAAIAFLGYAAAVLVAPLRAYWKTYTPLFIVDGYVRYRSLEPNNDRFIAVLDHERTLLHEWKLSHAPADVLTGTFPALVEFSDFGGVHRIDGRDTGVLPQTFMPFGIGNYSYGSRLYGQDIE